jgi:hypothetical protein
MIQLDPETFKTEEGGAYWRICMTDRLGQFDIDPDGAWDVAMPDGAALGVKRRQI